MPDRTVDVAQLPEPTITASTTYFAQREDITAIDGEWEDYTIRICNDSTPSGAREKFLAGEGVVVTGRRRVQVDA